MIQSENLDQLFTALSAFQGEVPNLFKSDTVKVTTKTGGSYSFKYVPLEEAVPVVRPLLAKHGLAVTQLLGAKSVLTILTHTSGQYIGRDFSYEHLLPKEADSQKEGGLITYFRRYSFMSICFLVADEDDDSNGANGNSFTKTPTKPAPKVTPPAPKPAPAPAPKASAPEPQEEPAPWEQDDTPAVTPEVNAGPASDNIPALIAHAKTFTSRPELQKWFQGVFAAASDKKTLSKELGSVVQGLMKTLA
jgi:hypothetical protein